MTKQYAVINKETQISVKYFETLEDAQELADFMTDYHSEEYEVIEL